MMLERSSLGPPTGGAVMMMLTLTSCSSEDLRWINVPSVLSLTGTLPFFDFDHRQSPKLCILFFGSSILASLRIVAVQCRSIHILRVMSIRQTAMYLVDYYGWHRGDLVNTRLSDYVSSSEPDVQRT